MQVLWRVIWEGLTAEDRVAVGHRLFRWHWAAANWVLRALQLKNMMKVLVSHTHTSHSGTCWVQSEQRCWLLDAKHRPHYLNHSTFQSVCSLSWSFSCHGVIPCDQLWRCWSRWVGLAPIHPDERGHPCKYWRLETYESAAHCGGKRIQPEIRRPSWPEDNVWMKWSSELWGRGLS